jgi:FkbM family methyltransferase
VISSLKRVAKSIAFGVRKDDVSGHYFYLVGGIKVFTRSAEECRRAAYRAFSFSEIYFKHYLPSGGDCVVDFGAGLGTEIVELARRSPDLKYVAVEIQPSVYECLCLTLDQLPDGFVPFGLAVGDGQTLRIAPTRAGINASTFDHGAVPVETVTWQSFLKRHDLTGIDLLKINIEGGEGPLLDHLDLDPVKRVIVSVHDFRADRGHGEHFRTRARVEARLKAAGFALRNTEGHADWMRSWLFAART